MFRSIALILSGNLTNAALMLARNLVIARLISLEDYGIASTFVLAVAIVEMMSALGLQQQMVQSKTGADPEFQAALQGFQALRGVMNGIFLFLLAGPLAAFFGVPEVTWAYRAIALVPLMQGFVHFDMYRMSRTLNYLPGTITLVVPPLASLLLVWPLYLIFADYRVLLFAILAQYALILTASHILAKRPYRLRLDRGVMARGLRFGWPLMLNGALMFAVFNGERMIVGRELGLEALALFSMAFSLTLSPALVLSRSAMSFFLPQLSGTLGTAPFPALAMAAFQGHLVLGCAMVLGVALVGGPFVHAVLGLKYADAIPLLTWLAILQALRVFKGGCSTVAMSAAHTENAMLANLVRVALLPLAWIWVAGGGDLLDVIWIGILGELAGLAIGLALALWRLDLPLRPLAAPLGVSAVLLGVAGLHAARLTDWQPDPLTGTGLAVLFALVLLAVRDLRLYLRHRTMSRHED